MIKDKNGLQNPKSDINEPYMFFCIQDFLIYFREKSKTEVIYHQIFFCQKSQKMIEKSHALIFRALIFA